jgi:hypothetical protein
MVKRVGIPELVDDLIPTSRAKSKWSGEWKEEMSALLREDKDDGSFLVPLTAEEEKRLRYGRRIDNVDPFSHFGPRWGKGLWLYHQVLGEGRDVWLTRLRNIGLFRVKSEDTLISFFKLLGEHSKRMGSAFSPDWASFVNIENVGGYRSALSFEAARADVQKWVQDNPKHYFWTQRRGLDEDDFIRIFREGCYRFLAMGDNVEQANERMVSVADFVVDSDRWSGAGSSNTRTDVSYLTAKGKKKQVRRTKNKLAIGTTVAGRLAWLSQRPGDFVQRLKLIMKREASKVRGVIGAGDVTYLNASYMHEWLDVAMAKHPECSLFFSSAQILEMFRNMVRSLNRVWSMPLDFSGYDRQFIRKMIEAMMDMIVLYIQINAHGVWKADLLRISQVVRSAYVGIGSAVEIFVDGMHARVEVDGGLLSGWKSTAFLGSMGNFGLGWVAKRQAEVLGIPDSMTANNMQGDDSKPEFGTLGAAIGTVKCLDLGGSTINPKKFWLELDRSEYLRQVARPEGVWGYPARGINSVIWRSPTSLDPPAGILRARETVLSWSTLLGRGMDRDVCMKLMLDDVSGGNNISVDIAYALIHSPAAVGGIGVQPWGLEWYGMQPGVIEVKTRLSGDVGGLDVERKAWDKSGMTVTDEAYATHLLGNLTTPGAATEITPGEVSRQGIFTPFRISSPKSQWPLSAQASRTYPGSLAAIYLDSGLSEKNWEWVHSVWVTPDQEGMSRAIESKGGRRVWIDWLRGKLAYSTPTMLGYNSLEVAVVFRKWARSAWFQINLLHSYTNTLVIESALSCELKTEIEVSHNPIFLGG